MSGLRLTQYNMHKSKKRVQTAFVAEAAKKGCEIIALQEPWQNTHMNGSSGFWPAYPKQFQSKACFLLRKTFPLSSWSVEYPAPNIASLTMQINNQTIHIHNVYSKPPGNYTHIDQNSPIFKLSELLKKPGEHVLLGDFNLHHPIWGGPQCLTRHNMADELLRMHGGHGRQIRLVTDLDPITMSIDLAVPCGLILNELISNAFKHAFPDEHGGDVIGIGLRCGDPNADGLAAAFGRREISCGWTLNVEREDVCPVLTLPEGIDFEEYLETLEKKHRHEIRRKIRRAAAAGQIELVESSDPLSELPAFIELHQKKWGADGLFPPTPGGERSRTFVRRMFEEFGPHGMLRLSFLSVGGRRSRMAPHVTQTITAERSTGGRPPASRA